jgi:multidrug efflux pump subunit AcrA (membrane-fusion protein)
MPFEQPFKQEHSEEVEEIIGAVPNWIIRWGISLLFSILLLILFFSAFIKSPDLVHAKLRVDSYHRPQGVIARRDGKLANLFVTEGQLVKKGEILGFLESTTAHRQLLEMSAQVDSLHKQVKVKNYDFLTQVKLNKEEHCGELQPYLQFLTYLPRGVYAKKETVVRHEIEYLKLLELQLEAELKINQEGLQLAEQEFEMQKRLAALNVLSNQEFRQKESLFLNSKIPLYSTRSALINNKISQNLKKEELVEMDYEIAEQYSLFLSSIQRFKSELDSWKKEYVLVAEQDGKVVFHQVIRENQWMRKNTPVLYILNELDQASTFGELILSQHSYGKIKKGQDVLVQLNAYPAQEFGLLKGEIRSVSEVVSGDTAFIAIVTLPRQTTYGKTVKLHIGLEAQSELVTDKYSLLERIFSSTRDVWTNK